MPDHESPRAKGQSKKTTKKRKKKTLAASPTITGDMAADELEFIKAIDDFKRKNQRPFPSWREVLSILKDLGYQKTGDLSTETDGTSYDFV